MQRWPQVATDFALSAGLSASLYGAMGFVGMIVGTAVDGPLAGAILGVLYAGYVAYRTYDWVMDKILGKFYYRPIDLAVEQTGHLIGGIVGGISIAFSVGFGY
jgi:hypothetical protein